MKKFRCPSCGGEYWGALVDPLNDYMPYRIDCHCFFDGTSETTDEMFERIKRKEPRKKWCGWSGEWKEDADYWVEENRSANTCRK